MLRRFGRKVETTTSTPRDERDECGSILGPTGLPSVRENFISLAAMIAAAPHLPQPGLQLVLRPGHSDVDQAARLFHFPPEIPFPCARGCNRRQCWGCGGAPLQAPC